MPDNTEEATTPVVGVFENGRFVVVKLPQQAKPPLRDLGPLPRMSGLELAEKFSEERRVVAE